MTVAIVVYKGLIPVVGRILTVKIEYEATDSDGQPYRSEYWFIMDKEAQCVIRSFEIPLL